MASQPNFDHDFGEQSYRARRSGKKRSFVKLKDDGDILGCNKVNNVKVEEAATRMILSLGESLQDCRNTLATCQTHLEAAKSEIQNWRSSLQPFIPASVPLEPKAVVTYLHYQAAFKDALAKKEQELAVLKSDARRLRAQLKPKRPLYIDYAVLDQLTRLEKLAEDKDKDIKELEGELAAVNFTAQSRMGNMLMAKCKTLEAENEEMGNQVSEGMIHDLRMKIALQKTQNAELRASFEAVCKHTESLANEVEKSNEIVHVLRGSLDERDAAIRRLKDELQMQKTEKRLKLDDQRPLWAASPSRVGGRAKN